MKRELVDEFPALRCQSKVAKTNSVVDKNVHMIRTGCFYENAKKREGK